MDFVTGCHCLGDVLGIGDFAGRCASGCGYDSGGMLSVGVLVGLLWV